MSAAIAVSYHFVQFLIPPCLRGEIAAREKLILCVTVWNVYPVHDAIPRMRMRATTYVRARVHANKCYIHPKLTEYVMKKRRLI